MSRSVTLIATVGISPAVLTETIWKLNEIGELPDRIFALTTTEGRDKIREHLFGSGLWSRFCADLGIRESEIHFPDRHMIVPRHPDGLEADDLRTYEDCMRFGDAIMEVVQDECSHSKRSVYASVAGGRKTMGAQLMAMMQVFGREQDKVFHILVDEPFESAPFYYPEQSQQEIKTRNGTEVIARNAKIELYEVPFIRMGHRFKIAPVDGQSFEEFVEDIQDQLASESFQLTLEPSNRVVKQTGYESNASVLNPRPYMWLLYFSLKNHEAGRITDVMFKPLFGDGKTTERIKLHLCYHFLTGEEWNEDGWYDADDGRLTAKAKKSTLKKSRFDFVRELKKLKQEIGMDSHDLFWLDRNGQDVRTNINRLNLMPDRISFRVSNNQAEEWTDHIESIWNHIPKGIPDYPKTVEDKIALVAELKAFFKPILKSE